MKMTTATTMHLLLLSFCIAIALCTYGEDLTRLWLKFRDYQSLSHLYLPVAELEDGDGNAEFHLTDLEDDDGNAFLSQRASVGAW
jgi:hypothetical protein